MLIKVNQIIHIMISGIGLYINMVLFLFIFFVNTIFHFCYRNLLKAQIRLEELEKDVGLILYHEESLKMADLLPMLGT